MVRFLPLLIACGLLLRAADPYQTQRDWMVSEQVEARGVRRAEVLRAMRATPRHLFVPEPMRPRAYDDSALPIGYGQTISQPYIVAVMTELLARYSMALWAGLASLTSGKLEGCAWAGATRAPAMNRVAIANRTNLFFIPLPMSVCRSGGRQEVRLGQKRVRTPAQAKAKPVQGL